jgi:translation initiation factor IF-3
MIMNEKIKASEVELKGVNGEDLGIVSLKEALRMAKQLKVDLVCTSLSSSPPPCELVDYKKAKEAITKVKQQKLKKEKGPKVKEIRLSASIEAHDYETKLRQAEKILRSGDQVEFIVRLQKGNEAARASELLKRMAGDLKNCGRQDKGIRMSGKQAAMSMIPLKM